MSLTRARRPAIALWPAGRRALDAGVGAPGVVAGGVALALAYLTLPPVVVLVQTSLTTLNLRGDIVALTLDHYTRVLTSPAILTLLANTLGFALGSCLLALLVGGALAWIVERTNTPLRRLGYGAALMSFALPYILYTIAWLLLLGKGGPVNAVLMSLAGSDEPVLNVYSLWGMILVEGFLWSPLVFLMLAAVFRAMDPALEEAALMSGANAWRTAFHISFRLALPGLAAVVLLVFIRALESFDIPALVGMPGSVQVFTTLVYQDTRRTPPDYGEASAFGVLLMLVVLACLYYYGRLTHASERFQTVTGKGYRPRPTDLGRWRYLTAALVLGYFALVMVAPLALVIWASVMPFYRRPAVEALASVTSKNYATVLSYPNFADAIRNTVVLGVGTATVVMALMALTAWLSLRGQTRVRGLLDPLASLPLVFPGIVLGLATLRLYLVLPIPIYATLWILLVAYATRYMPYGMRYCHAGLVQIHRELEEAAYVSGASWWTAFRRVLLPLLSPAFWAGWIFVFLLSAKELAMSVLLAGPQSQVVSVMMFDLWNNGQIVEVAAFGVVWSALLALAAGGFFVLARRYGLRMY
ncbi:MAG TPA: iron ABC transporter permease [Chloroflexota bacterium]|nr:iron ABC transporter permease [Chloroflexota bacterium]HZU05126.1 iron ABC transporter permease [Chloroflexota bacterium]